jgi:putative nucleotidyltransferase with HDIG domain
VSLDERLREAPAVARSAAALEGVDAWVVGGAVREGLLDRPVSDLDIAVAGGEDNAARAISQALDGHAFALSERFGTWRVAAPGLGVDVTRLRADGIEADLGARDFTVNAMAVPLAAAAAGSAEAELIDPNEGRADLGARLLRAVSPSTFEDDPLRVIRAARFTAALGMELEDGTRESARRMATRAGEPAGERQLAELGAIMAGPDPVRGLEVLDRLGATPAILPELDALRGVEQNPYHHLDVHGHTMEVLERMLSVENDLGAYVDDPAAVEGVLDEQLADGLSRRAALRFGALFHDLGKPETRSVNEEGRVLFLGHDRAGARIAGEIAQRLRASRRLRGYLERISLEHLRLGFLVHERPLSRRAVFEYLDATDPDAIDITLLTVADRLATQGAKTRPEAIQAHLDLSREMIGEALAWRESGAPRPPIRGDELAAELGIEPGPELGRLLRELAAAAFAGEATTREQAVAIARDKLGG